MAAVAARAGVSVSTASLAYSGAGPVSELTRDKVLAAAAELGYAGPDPRARSLRQGRSDTIGVVLESTVLNAFRDPVHIAFLDGIGQPLASSGRALLLIPEVGSRRSVLETAAVDALVLVGCGPYAAQAVDLALRRDISVVRIGGARFPGVVPITLDDEAASTTLAGHLAELGHTRVSVVLLPLEQNRSRGPLTPEREAAGAVTTSLDRLAGVRQVFPDVTGVVTAASLVEEGWLAGRALLTDGEQRLLPAAQRPTAIIAQSDLLAVGVIRAAEELGLRVPRDVSVVGFDGVRTDTLIPHDLTTMVQPAAEQGRAAGQAAIDLIEGGSPAGAAFTSVFHRGATTAPPAG